MAFARSASAGAGAEEGSPGLGKKMLIVLGIANVLMLGVYGWLRYSQAPTAQRLFKTAERDLLALKERAVQIQGAAYIIVTNDIQDVQEPGPLIGQIAREAGIAQNIAVEAANTRAWRQNSKYNEITVSVTNKNKTGYAFGGLVTLAEAIERKNPKIKILELDFGNRHTGLGEDEWRPSGKFLTVRAFAPAGPAR